MADGQNEEWMWGYGPEAGLLLGSTAAGAGLGYVGLPRLLAGTVPAGLPAAGALGAALPADQYPAPRDGFFFDRRFPVNAPDPLSPGQTLRPMTASDGIGQTVPAPRITSRNPTSPENQRRAIGYNIAASRQRMNDVLFGAQAAVDAAEANLQRYTNVNMTNPGVAADVDAARKALAEAVKARDAATTAIANAGPYANLRPQIEAFEGGASRRLAINDLTRSRRLWGGAFGAATGLLAGVSILGRDAISIDEELPGMTPEEQDRAEELAARVVAYGEDPATLPAADILLLQAYADEAQDTELATVLSGVDIEAVRLEADAAIDGEAFSDIDRQSFDLMDDPDAFPLDDEGEPEPAPLSDGGMTREEWADQMPLADGGMTREEQEAWVASGGQERQRQSELNDIRRFSGTVPLPDATDLSDSNNPEMDPIAAYLGAMGNGNGIPNLIPPLPQGGDVIPYDPATPDFITDEIAPGVQMPDVGNFRDIPPDARTPQFAGQFAPQRTMEEIVAEMQALEQRPAPYEEDVPEVDTDPVYRPSETPIEFMEPPQDVTRGDIDRVFRSENDVSEAIRYNNIISNAHFFFDQAVRAGIPEGMTEEDVWQQSLAQASQLMSDQEIGAEIGGPEGESGLNRFIRGAYDFVDDGSRKALAGVGGLAAEALNAGEYYGTNAIRNFTGDEPIPREEYDAARDEAIEGMLDYGESDYLGPLQITTGLPPNMNDIPGMVSRFVDMGRETTLRDDDNGVLSPEAQDVGENWVEFMRGNDYDPTPLYDDLGRPQEVIRPEARPDLPDVPDQPPIDQTGGEPQPRPQNTELPLLPAFEPEPLDEQTQAIFDALRNDDLTLTPRGQLDPEPVELAEADDGSFDTASLDGVDVAPEVPGPEVAEGWDWLDTFLAENVPVEGMFSSAQAGEPTQEDADQAAENSAQVGNWFNEAGEAAAAGVIPYLLTSGAGRLPLIRNIPGIRTVAPPLAAATGAGLSILGDPANAASSTDGEESLPSASDNIDLDTVDPDTLSMGEEAAGPDASPEAAPALAQAGEQIEAEAAAVPEEERDNFIRNRMADWFGVTDPDDQADFARAMIAAGAAIAGSTSPALTALTQGFAVGMDVYDGAQAARTEAERQALEDKIMLEQWQMEYDLKQRELDQRGAEAQAEVAAENADPAVQMEQVYTLAQEYMRIAGVDADGNPALTEEQAFDMAYQEVFGKNPPRSDEPLI